MTWRPTDRGWLTTVLLFESVETLAAFRLNFARAADPDNPEGPAIAALLEDIDATVRVRSTWDAQHRQTWELLVDDGMRACVAEVVALEVDDGLDKQKPPHCDHVTGQVRGVGG